MRIGGIAVVLACGAPVSAEPLRVEAGAFAGAQFLSPDIGLGSAMNAVERPQSAPLLGGRFTVVPLQNLAGDERWHLDLGFEGELAMAAAYTGHEGTRNGPYFSPLIDYRADVLLRLSIGGVRPHLAIGGGGTTFASASPTLDTQTVGVFFWGVGSTFAVSRSWDVRVDLRQDMLPRMGGGTASSYEASFGISVPLGGEDHEHVHVPPPSEQAAAPPPPSTPPELTPVTFQARETRPPPIPPDPNQDTDKDGFIDTQDKCPLDAENVNGFQDTDGCPDTIPQAITVAGPALKFAAGRATLDAADQTTLKPVIDVMVASADTKLVVIGHPERKGKAGNELAQRRAESVRWFLIEHGVADVTRVSSKVGAMAAKGGALIDLEVAAPAPPPAPKKK